MKDEGTRTATPTQAKREKLHQLVEESIEAHSFSAFPDINTAEVHDILKQHGYTLDAVSAYILRTHLQQLLDEANRGK